MRKIFGVLVGLLAAFLPALRAQTVLADIRGNYATSGTLTDTFGSGTWTYLASTAASAGTLTALTYGVIGDIGNSGYGLPGHDDFSVPGVSNVKLFHDGSAPSTSTTPGVGQLAWHPAQNSPTYTVLRWTAGAGEAGSIQVQGTFSRLGEPGGLVDFYIFVNGVQSYAVTGVTSGTSNYDFTTTIAQGQSVDFVLGDAGNGYGGDESLISGAITAIPEPSTCAVTFGALALGLAGVRKFRRAGAV